MGSYALAGAIAGSAGLGTLPAMVASGALGGRLLRLRRNQRFRVIAGLAVVALGLWTLGTPVLLALFPAHQGAH